MIRLLLALVLAIGLASCGKDSAESGIIPGCHPAPVADAGEDQVLILGFGLSDEVELGSVGHPGMTYEWSPSDTLDDPKSPQPYATPLVTTTYLLTARNQCGYASAKVTVRVYEQDSLE
jgi:hypothetical protein